MHREIQKMREIALVYLDRSGGLQKFVHDCKKYNDSKQSYAVYRFVISINPSDIAELDATLGNCILHNPIQAAQIFQSVCFIAIKTLSLIDQLQTEAQISILLKPTHLPPLPSYVLSLSVFPFNYTSQRFYMSEGIAIAMGTVTKYTQGARFLCTEETCPFSEGFRYIRVHLPGATESATVRSDFVCSLCSSPLQENMKFRVLGDKQIVEMIDAKVLDALKGYCNDKSHFRIQTFTVFLRDELANKMKIGDHYKIIGIPACVQNGLQATTCIEVNSVQLCKPNGPSSVSKNFKYLLSLTSSSCWRFTAILVNIFASQVVPPGTYNTLKLAVLLSLVQTGEKENADYLDLLIVTSDTLVIDRLLNYSVCLLPRGIRHPPSSEIFPSVSKDKHGTGSASIQACSAVLAKGGICYIGDLSSYKKDKLELLQSVLESRTTTVFIPGKKYGEEADQHVTIPVQTNFWSFVDVDSSSKKHIQKDNFVIGQMDMSLIPPNLVDVFGLLIYNEFPSCQLSSPLVHHVLKKAINPEATLYKVSQQFRTQDYEEFILFAKNLHVELSAEAESLIQGYYLASRRVRRDSVHGSTLSASALKTLISLSKAHTKLSLRKKVLEEDALIAILLLESSLTLKHGKSALCIAPNPVFPFDLSDENSLQERDFYLMQCHHQLLKFIGAYGPGIHELTGKLPREYPLDPGEEPPIVRRRIGTAFKLDEQKILPKGEEAELERLEREFAIQSQITEAARRLASDPNVSKKLKKQRKTSYLNALKKLQEIENAINEYRIKSGKKPTQRASLIIDEGNIASEDSSLSDALVLEDEDSQVTSTISPLQSPHKGLPPRPPLHNRPPPPQSLEGLRQMHYHRNDYDKSPIKPKMWSESSLDEPYEKVKKRSSHSHSSSHKRFPSTGSCAEAGGSSSLQNSPIRSLPHWNSQSSMPSTPDLRVRSPHYVHSTRSVDISPTRLHSLAQHFRHRSSSLESQGKLLGSENETGSPDFYTPRTRSSNGSDPMDDCSSCTSHSSSEHYYPAQMNPNYSTLAEDSPSKARERQRQRHKSAGNLVSSNSGSMPNLAARNGTGHHRVYLHSQSQPSSQYRIKEYPLYIEGSSTPVVVRSLENDQEGHYSVKAQFKTSNSYTAGGMFKENWHGDEVDSVRLTPSRSQIIRTPSLGREGHEKGSGRTAVSDELRLWYQRSTASHKEHSRLSHTSSTSSDSSSQYSTSSQSTFVAHSRVTRMPQMCKATSAALPHSQRSSTPSSELAATPPGSPHHILAWQTGEATDNSPTMDESQSPTHQSTDE